MNDREKWSKRLTIGGSVLATIFGALSLWAAGGSLSLDSSGQSVLLLGGAIAGAGVGIIFFGTFSPIIVLGFSGDVRMILLLSLSLASAIAGYRMLRGGGGGNAGISVLGAFVGLFIPLFFYGFIASVLNSFRS
jgi:hypothetical protein